MLKTIIIFFLTAAAVMGQDVDLANAYFKQGEYDKANELYKKISKDKDQARIIHNNYLLSLQKVKDFEEADKFIKRQIKANENIISYKADYAQFLEYSGKPELARKEFDILIDNASKVDAYVYELQNYFYRVNKIDLAIKLLLTSRERGKDPYRHDVQLARAYLYVGQKEKMLEEVLGFGQRNQNPSYVQATIQDNIKEEAEIEMLEKILYSKIQANPNETFYSEILIWHLVQKHEFARAFLQTKAIDKRLKLEGMKVFELAALAFQNGDFRNASKMYQYVMEEYPSGDFYPIARRLYIQSKEELVKNTYPVSLPDIKELIVEYEGLIKDLGRSPKTIEALRNLALLHAFYLNDHNKAIEILQSAIQISANNPKFRDQCKLDMGDIYILKDEPWESTLLYMQVEKNQKEDNLGEVAKLKNARLQYYTGQFELSKDILDILKKATTREIANDAMQLSLLIQDNIGLDTSETAMKEFAKVDLLIFQNKHYEAITALESLFQTYKSHSLADEILWLRANTYLKINEVDKAILDLNTIINDYKYDILSDDAMFTLAKTFEEKKGDKVRAMEYYKQILKDYPGSIYGAQARIKFRELRGDFVN